MTWRSATSSKILAGILGSLLAGCVSGAELNGRIQLIDSRSSGKKGGDFSGVIVWLISREGLELRKPTKHAEMMQKDKRFSPHVLVVPTGTVVDFPNLDPIFHNAFSNFDGQIFDVTLYPPGTSRSVHFERPGIVRVFCNIHPSMSAIIAVVDSPYYATTAKDGRFTIPNVKAGEYDIHFFYERAVPETLAKLSKGIEVGSDPMQIPLTSISESGYLPVAHKNKYGRDYPPDADQSNYRTLPLK